MSLQVRSQKSPPKLPHRQMILAMEKLPLSDQIPSGVRSKCVVLMAELLRAIIFRSQPSEGDCDELHVTLGSLRCIRLWISSIPVISSAKPGENQSL